MFAEIIMDSHDIARWADDHRSDSMPTSIFPAKDLEIIDRQDTVLLKTFAFYVYQNMSAISSSTYPLDLAGATL